MVQDWMDVLFRNGNRQLLLHLTPLIIPGNLYLLQCFSTAWTASVMIADLEVVTCKILVENADITNYSLHSEIVGYV